MYILPAGKGIDNFVSDFGERVFIDVLGGAVELSVDFGVKRLFVDIVSFYEAEDIESGDK